MEKKDYSHLSPEERAHEEFADKIAQESVDNLNKNVSKNTTSNLPIKEVSH